MAGSQSCSIITILFIFTRCDLSGVKSFIKMINHGIQNKFISIFIFNCSTRGFFDIAEVPNYVLCKYTCGNAPRFIPTYPICYCRKRATEKENCGKYPFSAPNWQEESEIKVVEVKNIQSKPNPHGVDARNLSDTKMAQVVHITLQPGESLKKHITPVDVVFYVLEGQGVVEIGEERKEVGVDTLIESPARIPHRWINESKGLVRILVIKTPRPKETTKTL